VIPLSQSDIFSNQEPASTVQAVYAGVEDQSLAVQELVRVLEKGARPEK